MNALRLLAKAAVVPVGLLAAVLLFASLSFLNVLTPPRHSDREKVTAT